MEQAIAAPTPLSSSVRPSFSHSLRNVPGVSSLFCIRMGYRIWVFEDVRKLLDSLPFFFRQVYTTAVFVNIAAPTRLVKGGFPSVREPAWDDKVSEVGAADPQSCSGSGFGSGQIMGLRVAPAPARHPCFSYFLIGL